MLTEHPPLPPDSQPYSDPDSGANHGRYHLPADQQVQVKLLVSSLCDSVHAGWNTGGKLSGIYCVSAAR